MIFEEALQNKCCYSLEAFALLIRSEVFFVSFGAAPGSMHVLFDTISLRTKWRRPCEGDKANKCPRQKTVSRGFHKSVLGLVFMRHMTCQFTTLFSTGSEDWGSEPLSLPFLDGEKSEKTVSENENSFLVRTSSKYVPEVTTSLISLKKSRKLVRVNRCLSGDKAGASNPRVTELNSSS